MSKIKVLIVEDEVAIAEDLQDIVEIAGYNVVDIAFSYDQAIAILADKKPDIALLDIALTGNGTGLDIAKILNNKYKIPFIFLTSFSDQGTIQEVVNLNPSGYLVKPYKESDIAPVLALALANSKLLSKQIFPVLELINEKLVKPISPQEYRVLKLIWKGKKNNEIAKELFVSINTIKTHIVKLYTKLDVNSRASAINKVMDI